MEEWNFEKAKEMHERHEKILRNNPTKEQIVEIVKELPYIISTIEEPSEEAIIAAIETDPHSIIYISPYLISENVQIKLMEKNVSEMNYIEKINGNVQIEMVKRDPKNIRLIRNPIATAQVIAVQKDPNLIQSINGNICLEIYEALKNIK